MSTDELYDRAVALADEGDVDEALEVYREVVRLDPRHADAWINLGVILDDRCEAEEALTCYAKAIAIAPDDAVAWSNRGNSFAQLARFSEAIACFDKAIALGDARSQQLRVRALVHAGRVDEANRNGGHALGEARERRHAGVVGRYFIGAHTNPELLDAAVERLVQLTAGCRDTPKGIRAGSTLQLGWTMITLAAEGDDLVLCEPDWHRDPRKGVVRELSVSAQQQVLALLVHQIARAPMVDCSCHDLFALDFDALGSARVHMRRRKPVAQGDSGWVLTGAPDEAPSSVLPLSTLVNVRPHLLKIVALPIGWRVQFDDHALTGVWDEHGQQRIEQ